MNFKLCCRDVFTISFSGSTEANALKICHLVVFSVPCVCIVLFSYFSIFQSKMTMLIDTRKYI